MASGGGIRVPFQYLMRCLFHNCKIWQSLRSMKLVSKLTHWGRDKMAASFMTTFSNAFSWLKNVIISITISLKFVPKGSINNIPTLVQIMVWRRPGDKPLSEPMMVTLPTHICVTRPQWVKIVISFWNLAGYVAAVPLRLWGSFDLKWY